MKKEWLVKTLALGIVVLFICMNVKPSLALDNVKKSSISVSDDNILYVGGSGQDNYTKIQDAVDNASDDDIVFVYEDSSPYYENIVIHKSIILMGEERNSVIVNGGGSGKVVYCNASNVTICGFTIQNSGNDTWEDAGIFIDNTDNNNIIGNIIANNNNGLVIKSSDHNNVVDNTVTMNIGHGAFISSCKNNSILGNNITLNSYDGICLLASSRNDIQGNILENNEQAIGIVLFSDHNTVIGNTIKNSSYRGLMLDGYCDENIIQKNNFIKNKRHVEFYNSIENFWDENYWDNWIGLKIMMFQKFPKFIFGRSMTMVINFDWHPAKEPYNIPTGGVMEK